jgi:hypothetical protein
MDRIYRTIHDLYNKIDNGVYLVAADPVKPGILVFLSDTGSDPVWSPDGKWIVYAAII